MLCFILTILNFAAILVKTCIYDKGNNSEERTIVVHWMCCIRLGRFKDLKVLEKPKEKKKKSKSDKSSGEL